MEEQNQNLNQPEQIQPGVQQQQQPPVQAMIHTNHVPMQQFNQGASQPNAGPSQPSYQQGQPTFGQSSSFAPQQNYASQQGGPQQQGFAPQQNYVPQQNYYNQPQQNWAQPRQGYGMPPVPPQPPVSQMNQIPPQKPQKPKKQNGWKVAVALICAITLIISVAAGTWLSSVLSDNKGGDFVLPQASTTEENMGYLDSVQNSSYGSVSDIAEDVGQSVVTIIVSTDYNSYFMQYTGESLGSGIIIGEEDDKIYIATNFHVIDSASDVSIIAGSDNSATIQAYYQGADSDTDLAVIYIKKSEVPEEVRAEMKIATLGSSDDMRLGDLAIAIGSPVDKSFGNSVTAGTISGLERSVSFVDEETQTSQTLTLMQTDAAINPGNSGGALVNGRGEVIGINNAKISSTEVEGMGFAIPIDSAKPILEQLINEGKVVRPYIGITGIEVANYAEFAQQYQILSGVIVISVMEEGPALKAGLQPYDVIISMDGEPIETFSDLTSAIADAGIGETVELEILRGYQEGDPQIVTKTLTIAEKNTTGRK